jgi:hypothetical protein
MYCGIPPDSPYVCQTCGRPYVLGDALVMVTSTWPREEIRIYQDLYGDLVYDVPHYFPKMVNAK